MRSMMIRRIVDVGLTVLLLCLMAYQVTGEAVHEWVGIIMTALVIVHQILNRKWYAALFKGKYNAYRILTTIINAALLVSFALTAICGMAMSAHAVPFMYGMVKVSVARQLHLAMSHWAFVLMGLHLGMHIPAMTAKMKLSKKAGIILSAVICAIAGIGLFLFLKNGMPDYMLFKVPFAFLDYEKAGALVFLENILMLLFWAFVGAQAALLCRNSQTDKEKNNKLLPVLFIMAAIIIGLVINMISGKMSPGDGVNGPSWADQTPVASSQAAADKTEPAAPQ